MLDLSVIQLRYGSAVLSAESLPKCHLTSYDEEYAIGKSNLFLRRPVLQTPPSPARCCSMLCYAILEEHTCCRVKTNAD